MLYRFTVEEFDHTRACYITDYMISLEFTLLYFYFGKEYNPIQMISINALLYSALATFTASVMHQFYTTTKYQNAFTLLWHISTIFSILIA